MIRNVIVGCGISGAVAARNLAGQFGESFLLIGVRPHDPGEYQLFPATQKNGMTELFYIWQKIREQLGRSALRLMALRQSMAARLMHESVPKSELKSILGDYSYRTLQAIQNEPKAGAGL